MSNMQVPTHPSRDQTNVDHVNISERKRLVVSHRKHSTAKPNAEEMRLSSPSTSARTRDTLCFHSEAFSSGNYHRI